MFTNLVISAEEGSSLLPKRSVFFRIFMKMEKVLVNAAEVTRIQPFPKTRVLQLCLLLRIP
jgi:hypothetical protein